MIPTLKLRLLVACCAVLILVALAPPLRAQAEPLDQHGFAPINLDDLALKDNPLKPGVSAMILYRDVYVDDYAEITKEYFRIKVFTDEGKKYADVEVPIRGAHGISGVHARTIHPDGSVADFDGKVFEKVVVKGKGIKIRTETFTLPDVRAGSVIEYGYTKRWGKGIPPDAILDSTIIDTFGSMVADRWIIDDELFTRHAHFSFRPLKLAISWVWDGLPAGEDPQEQKDGTIALDVTNVLPFLQEAFMPPEDTFRSRVEFYYVPRSLASTKDSGKFWVDRGKRSAGEEDKFIGKHKGIKQKVDETVSVGDPPEVKLRKLYAEAQKIRNLSFESEKTAKEEKREKLKDNDNVEDVLKHGYGDGSEINALFVALARTAGFDASTVRAVSRRTNFFNPHLINWGQLDSGVVEVKLGTKKLYLDPATRFCPFGLLPWEETGVQGVRLDKDGGAIVTTTQPVSSDAVTERNATLQWEDGTLGGKLEVSFRGQDALERRLANREEDEAGRRKKLEDEVKDWLPSGATVKQVNATGWDGSDQPLVASFDIQVPNFGASTGRRLLLPVGIFQANGKNPFQHSNRVHPVYFSYPWQEVDDIRIELPKNYEVETLPAAKKSEQAFGRYEVSSAKEAGGLHIQRKLIMDGVIFQTGYYPYLRAFYSEVGAGDELQLVLRTAEVRAKP